MSGYTNAHQSNRVNLVLGGTLGTGTALSGSYLSSTGSLATTWVKYGAVTTYGTCNNLYCHIQAVSPAWNATITTPGGCLACHLKGIVTTGVSNNRSSGLHYWTTAPTVSQRMHDDGIATSSSKCGYCHASLTVQTSHVNGMFQAGLGTFYVQTSDGVGYCAGGTLGSTGCHDGGGDQGLWRRRWDRTISYAPIGTTTTCAGCHGGFGTGDWTWAHLQHRRRERGARQPPAARNSATSSAH